MKKGFTLIEVLVSLFIFTLVILAAYKIYDHSQKTYLMGEQLTDTQQGTRFAFEKLAHDLRVTGYHVYPDSNALRPDLAVEAMWPGAIAVRADFNQAEELDLECTKNAITNDCVAGTGEYGFVTTGNSDIRVYVLKSPFPPSDPRYDPGTDLKFKADLSGDMVHGTQGRDGIVGDAATLETVTISGACITQTKPPYKLYQVSFLDPIDPAYVNIPAGGAVPDADMVWTPIADNIFSMNFEYYNQNGIAEENLMDADPDIASDPADRPLYRREHGWPFGGVGGSNTVKNVIVNIIGMTARADAQYTDPVLADPNFTTKYTDDQQAAYTATKGYRKYALASTINMLNVGVAPHELADTVPPDDPTQLEAVIGYCGGALLTWNPSHAEDLAAYWVQVVDNSLWGSWGNTFKYNCDDAPSTCYGTSNPENYSDRVGFYVRNLSNGASYHSRVFSQDNAGNFSRNPTNQIDFIVKPSPLKPSAPTWPDKDAVYPIQKDDRPLKENVTIGGLTRMQVNFTGTNTYDTTQNTQCSNPPGGDPTPLLDDGFWPQVRDLFGYRLYHRRQLSATPDATALDPPVPQDLVATETQPASDPLTLSRNSYPDLKACPCEFYTYKMKAVTACEDANDDYTKSPPCLHVGDLSVLSRDESAPTTPLAVQAPMLGTDGVYPEVVPGKPAKPLAFSTASATPGYYDIILQFPAVTSSALKNNDIGDNTTYTIPNPDPNAQFEIWRYRIYEYTENPDVNTAATATPVPDTNLVANDQADNFDARVDSSPPLEVIGTLSLVNFKFQNTTEITPGQFRYYAVRGLFRCDAGGTTTFIEGPRSEAVQVPCNVAWSAVITSPSVDYTLVTGGSNIWRVTFSITGIPAGVTITGVNISIPMAGVDQAITTMTCSGTPATCTGYYDWDTNGLANGSYPILLRVSDSNGCESTPVRIANISQACGPFDLSVFPVSANQLTWQILKANDTEFYLLDRIRFTSETYKYMALDYFQDPLLSTPFNLWTTPVTAPAGVNLGDPTLNQSIGSATSGSPNIYNQTNFCSGDAARKNLLVHKTPASPAGAGNWFRATFDKNLTAANGPLNLLGSFSYKKCDQEEVQANITVPRKGTATVQLVKFPACAWTWSLVSGRAPTVDTTLTNLCTGTIVFKGSVSGAGTVTVTAFSPSAAFTCEFVPILLGP